MVDIAKQIAHWRSGSDEDWEVACELLEKNRIRHGLFFAHLALEKALKAHVCLTTGDLAPRLHNLVGLHQLAGIHLQVSHVDVLATFNRFALEGRYPDQTAPTPSRGLADAYMKGAKEVLECLIQQL